MKIFSSLGEMRPDVQAIEIEFRIVGPEGTMTRDVCWVREGEHYSLVAYPDKLYEFCKCRAASMLIARSFHLGDEACAAMVGDPAYLMLHNELMLPLVGELMYRVKPLLCVGWESMSDSKVDLTDN